MNQVSGFVGKFSNLKHDILNYNYGCFKYSKEGPYIIIPGIYIPQKIDILIEINNFEEKYFSNNTPYLFMKNHKRVFCYLSEKHDKTCRKRN